VLAFPPFAARPPWWGADLQTLHNYLLPWRWADLSAFPATRLELAMADGSGDRLVATVNRPAGSAPARPAVVLIHGLTGCESSAYILNAARHLLGLGFTVVRLNLRGAGPSGPLCRYAYHAGRSEDLRDALRDLATRLPDSAREGLLLAGFSLGGNMLLKFLAEFGGDFPVRAAASVSAPIDLAAAARRFLEPRNLFYHRYILARMKDEALATAAEFGPREQAAIREARTVYAFDDAFVAPRNGFTGADDYYRRCSGEGFMAAVRVPTLVISARDDPWIPAAPYLRYDWRANPALTALLPAGGGHVGFHGRGGRAAWHERCIGLFFERASTGRGRAAPG